MTIISVRDNENDRWKRNAKTKKQLTKNSEKSKRREKL